MDLGHILVDIEKDVEVFSPLPISRNGAEIVERKEFSLCVCVFIYLFIYLFLGGGG